MLKPAAKGKNQLGCIDAVGGFQNAIVVKDRLDICGFSLAQGLTAPEIRPPPPSPLPLIRRNSRHRGHHRMVLHPSILYEDKLQRRVDHVGCYELSQCVGAVLRRRPRLPDSHKEIYLFGGLFIGFSILWDVSFVAEQNLLLFNRQVDIRSSGTCRNLSVPDQKCQFITNSHQ